MFRFLVFVGVFTSPLLAFANPSLEDLIAQKRCMQVKDKPNAFDCMVDQPDGSMKKTRYFQALNPKKIIPSDKRKDEGSSPSKTE